ncbi:hypothetical protein KCP78_11245 [Salmonella enterica subsp. enterica]|nr:hypothetical protein KCP78_11245 [Salmonella enterica subsp. enterica]
MKLSGSPRNLVSRHREPHIKASFASAKFRRHATASTPHDRAGFDARRFWYFYAPQMPAAD